MTIKRVGILGSGIMGSGIAEVVAKAGHEVVLRSRQQSTADATLASLEKSLARQVAKGRLEQSAADETLGLIRATDSLEELSDSDLVIASIVEDLDHKRAHFEQLDKIGKPGAILATTTSSLPVVEMAAATGRP